MRRGTFYGIVIGLLTAIVGLLVYIAASEVGMRLYCSNSGPGDCVTQWYDTPGGGASP